MDISLREIASKQYVAALRALHGMSSGDDVHANATVAAQRRVNLMEHVSDDDDLDTNKCVDRVIEFWDRAKELFHITKALELKPAIFSKVLSLRRSVERNLTELRRMRDLHEEGSPIKKLVKMYISYASMVLDFHGDISKSVESKRKEESKTLREKIRHDDGVVEEESDEDDDETLQSVFDMSELSRVERWPETGDVFAREQRRLAQVHRRSTAVYKTHHHAHDGE